ncbi:hypothetical protein CN587_29765 [Bacillus wiedmannii]|nr:hypothetical protein CN622_30200 [Bacillus wiedmannii]PEO05795.1 hypothetical protein CN562_29635 [Bacillus wiedmannii]PEP99153.1 hypothetical protein CN587_29765 [Bacillus wiedmannii]
MIKNKEVSFNTHRLITKENTVFFAVFSICYNGEFIAQEIINTNIIKKLLTRIMKVGDFC